MITIPTPASLHNYKSHLREFVGGMVQKLDLNSHKDTPSKAQIETILTLLEGEIEEFRDQLRADKLDPNALMELCDTANYAFLAYVALRNEGTANREEEIINENFNIDVESGKIFCNKLRSGGRYKIGEEVKGNVARGGYIYINLSTRRGLGGRGSVPRSHLVWWKKTGQWPTNVIDHINGMKNDDRGDNLRDVTHSENNSFAHDKTRKHPPFVTQFLPKGKEHTSSYGKFVYQKTHKGCVLRVSYFNTPEEAATLGKAKWEKRVREIDATK